MCTCMCMCACACACHVMYSSAEPLSRVVLLALFGRKSGHAATALCVRPSVLCAHVYNASPVGYSAQQATRTTEVQGQRLNRARRLVPELRHVVRTPRHHPGRPDLRPDSEARCEDMKFMRRSGTLGGWQLEAGDNMKIKCCGRTSGRPLVPRKATRVRCQCSDRYVPVTSRPWHTEIDTP